MVPAAAGRRAATSVKGIVMAGGQGTRLRPLTVAVNKHLLPIFDKPLIYYPLSVLMFAGIRDVAVMCAPQYRPQFERVLGDGRQWGMAFTYLEQTEARGVGEVFLLGRDFIAQEPVCVVLGDNVFYGHGLPRQLQAACAHPTGAQLFAYPVADPQAFGVVEFDAGGQVVSLEEKPSRPKSRYAVTGLYFYDTQVCDLARDLAPSARGELEITDVNHSYLRLGQLQVTELGRGTFWLDAGTHQSMLEASQFVQTLQERQGTMISAPEEIAWRQGFISTEQLMKLGAAMAENRYGQYLCALAQRTGQTA